ncbi:diguanylate cyclase/phosphodiesterase with PAS/PAC sensor(s) [Domibacillus enclensis]|uniref:Diguanylate cyclase/phosphodiesterase with PAS/PAC sensor(S) n=2 Tax=Domibacillus enclensis TaxID=1017273 RepID=A0A1N6P4K5_9BACI|nr:diguanylate cyclase/phosphodiesterase with PAS/PAC sensor(s) [Domibacillus enclensis]
MTGAGLLMKKEKTSNVIIDHIREGVMITDHKGIIEYVNPAFQVVTGYTESEAIGKTPNMLQSGIHDERFYTLMWSEVKKRGKWSGEIWNRRKNGDLYAEWLTILAVSGDEGQIEQYIGVFTDISDQKTAEEELKKLAHHDSLTGVANRYAYHNRLASIIETSIRFDQKLAVFFLDLDRFKQVNDTFGHSAGDQLLVELSTRLKRLLGNKDFIARLGGDEFSIALTNIRHAREAFGLAEAIIHSFSVPFQLEGQDIYMSTSIGISFFPEDGLDVDTLINKADKAMYYSKEKSRNRFSVYHEDMDRETKEVLTIEMELRKAIERQELSIHYQPKVDVKRNKAAGAEALLRWNNQHFGEVPPSVFIPIAEETGLIIPIGEWVLHQVCRDLTTLDQYGFADFSIAVNVSAVQFSQDRFVESFRSILFEENMSARRIELELTESTVMPDARMAVQRLTQLKTSGFKLSIDDFGTGYSSFSYLKRFPIDYLKIDRSFIKMMDQYDEDSSIVEAIITMAHRLRLKVVAEGVENKRQLELLKKESCEIVQGYYYSKPVPLSAFIDFLFMEWPDESK